MQYAEELLRTRGMAVSHHKSNGFPSLVGTTTGTKTPKILLQAHLDVVPGRKTLCTMAEKDGKLYGRGVFDMKFAVACYMQLVEDLKHEISDYDFGIMLTSDEEIGGEDGVGYLLEQGYGADVCILPDGGNAWEIENASNGVWHIRLMAKGKTAHGSRPWEGVNAIEGLARAVLEIREAFGEHNYKRSSITVSQIKGGVAINQVPATAEATLDMRFIDAEDYKLKRSAVESIAKAHRLEIHELSQQDPGKIDLKDPAIANFIKVADRIRGKPLGQARSCGSSDARFFLR